MDESRARHIECDPIALSGSSDCTTADDGSGKCVVQLAVGEAEVLHGALDSLVFDAALRSSDAAEAVAATTQ
ncbi:hypothetical protein Acsp02_75550 [Actinoplanes sp. NBRC 103695]|nr:hypothetical protein Acsp02_75550 [Actinoplanes sp. NBRC 103695]